MADDKRERGTDPRTGQQTVSSANPLNQTVMTDEERARASQAQANQLAPQHKSEAKRKLQAQIDAGKPNLTAKSIEGHIQGQLLAAGKEPADAKRLAAERAAEMTSDEDEAEKTR